MTTTTRCVIGAREHAAVAGLLLCEGHLARLRTMLGDLVTEAAILSAVPSMALRYDRGAGGLASERAPARLDVLALTDPRRGTGKSETDDDAAHAGEVASILDVLGSWARVVREERNLTATGTATIVGEAGTLLTHLPWLAAQPFADETYAEVRGVLEQVRAANGTGADRPAAACPVIAGDGVCGGRVWVRDELRMVWRRWPDRCTATHEAAPGALVCDRCGASWDTDAERARFRRMTQAATYRTADGTPMMTAQELVDAGMAPSVKAVHKRASRAGVRAVDGYYDPALWDGDLQSA